MGNKRDEELKNIMNVEMSKAVQLDEVIHMLVFDNIKISEGIIKELDNGKSGYQLLVDY
nr:MAG TPA: hypothetical protein [Caudoviricetes sp.]